MKTLKLPEIGSRVQVTTSFRETYLFADSPFRLTDYEGDVVAGDPWTPADSFKLFTGNPHYPYSVISVENVKDIKYLKGQAGRQVNSDSRTWQVEGSKGSTYTVTQTGTKWSCTCSGFQFRRQCRHIKEKQNV